MCIGNGDKIILNSGEFFEGDWETGACGKFLSSTEYIATFDKEAVCVYVYICTYFRTLRHGSIAPSSAVGLVPLS